MIFAEFYVRGRLVFDIAARTAVEIVTQERLFRLGIAGNLGVFAIDIALIFLFELVTGFWLLFRGLDLPDRS